MGFFGEFTGYKYASFEDKAKQIGVPRTASSTIGDATQKRSRVARKDLELLYIQDAQTFKLINSYKQLLLQAGYRIVSDNKGNQKKYDEFFKEIGGVGLHYKLQQLLERVIHDLALYGHAYVERIFDKGMNAMLDLKPIDAKLMDYVRDRNDRIMVDDGQNPLGYIMNVGYYSDGVTDTAPEGSKIDQGVIFLKPERIAHFILSPFGNGFEAVGLVEPAYTQITRKMKIEESASNAVYNSADSLIYGIVGNETRNPSNQLMKSTLDTLKNWTTNKRAVFAHPTQVGTLPVVQSPQVQELLKYLRQDQATAGGVSLGMAIGSGEANNKSTMNTERKDFNTKLNSVARSVAIQFSSKILDPLYEHNGFGSKAVLIWNDVSVDDRADMVNHIKLLFDMNAITSREARNYAKNVFDLETDDEEWEESQVEIAKLPEMPDQTPGAPLDEGEGKLGDVAKKVNPKTPESPVVKKNIKSSKDSYEEKRE